MFSGHKKGKKENDRRTIFKMIIITKPFYRQNKLFTGRSLENGNFTKMKLLVFSSMTQKFLRIKRNLILKL